MKDGEENDQLEVRTGFGSLKASGSVVTVVAVIFAGFLSTAYMIRDHDQRQSIAQAAARNERQDQFKQMEDNQKALIDAMNNMTYVLTLPQNRRETLNMDMPQSMRDRLLSQERFR